MDMNQMALLFAAFCIAALGLAHTVLGERGIVQPILQRMDWKNEKEGADFLNGTVRFAWHLTTVAWFGFAFLLLGPLLGLSGEEAFVPVVVAVMSLISGVFAFFYTRGRHLAWVVFLIITVACIWPYFWSAMP